MSDAANPPAASSASRLLICGAFAPEIDLLQERSGEQLPGGGVVECVALGIGSVAAAIALQARLLDPERPAVNEVLFVGSAGVYDPQQPAGPGAFGLSASFCKRDLAVLEGRAAVPQPLQGEVLRGGSTRGAVLARLLLHAACKDLPDGLTNSTDSISLVTLNFSRSNAGSQSNSYDAASPDFENLEGYGVARVCWQYDLPCAAIYALTNHVGPEGSAQWRANFRSMSNELQALLASAIFAD